MSKSLKFILILVLLFAVGLMALLVRGMAADRKTFREKQAELEISRAAWEKTAEEKEALQEELQEITDALKEARLTLQEKEARAEELRADIDTLKQDIAELKSRIGSSRNSSE